ncbi:MAG: hemerythrin family protein [Methylococcaceae bacterium]|nr:hemerythrin family protein [Methylococcaceae bacterium]
MENKNVLHAEDIPQVAMDAMNDVHRNELDIVNCVNVAILDNNIEEITRLCDSWLEHTRAHFNRENSMMEKYGFPAYDCHQGEHINAFEELESIVKAWKDTKDQHVLAIYVRDTWPKWYVNHISTMDIVTSAFIKQGMLNE